MFIENICTATAGRCPRARHRLKQAQPAHQEPLQIVLVREPGLNQLPSSPSDGSGVSAYPSPVSFPGVALSSAVDGYFSFTHSDQSFLSCSRLPGALCSSNILVRKRFLSSWLTSARLHASFKSDAVAKGAIHKSRSTMCSVCADKNGTLVPSALPYQNRQSAMAILLNYSELLHNTLGFFWLSRSHLSNSNAKSLSRAF